jgi:choline monooxygenase
MPAEASIRARIEREVLPDLLRPIGAARGLPHWAYTDPEVWALERGTLFSQGWIGVAFESDLPQPGDCFPVDFAGHKLLLTRGQDGTIRAFHNICPHRGMPLLDSPRSNCRTIACPWHAWTFGLDGALVATPNIGGVNRHADPAAEPAGLAPLGCGTWLGVVFVDVSGRAGALQDWLAPMRERLSAFDLSLTEEAPDQAVDHVYPANWKQVIEGAVEDYHIPWVHRQVGPQGRYEAVLGERFLGVSSWRDMETALRRLPPGADGVEAEPLPVFPHMPDRGEFEASLILTMVPSPVVAAQIGHVAVSLYVPLDPGRTLVRRRFRFLREAASSARHAVARRRVRDSWQTVTDQDAWVHEAIQSSLAAREAAGFRARFSPFWECAVHHFQALVATRLLGGGPG